MWTNRPAGCPGRAPAGPPSQYVLFMHKEKENSDYSMDQQPPHAPPESRD